MLLQEYVAAEEEDEDDEKDAKVIDLLIDRFLVYLFTVYHIVYWACLSLLMLCCLSIVVSLPIDLAVDAFLVNFRLASILVTVSIMHCCDLEYRKTRKHLRER